MEVKKGCIPKNRRIKLTHCLNRIEGQVRGIGKMVEHDRYCVDILQQVSSTFEALRGVSKILMRNYLDICATSAIQSKNREKQEQIYNELMDIIFRFSK